MFTFVSKVFEKIWWEGDDSRPIEKHPESNSSVRNKPTTHIESELPAGSQNEKRFIGQVTSLHNGYGLIDHEIYFSFSLFKDSIIPKVGSTLDVQAQRKHEVGGWKAISIIPHKEVTEETWDESKNVAVSNGGAGSNTTVITDAMEHFISQVGNMERNVGYLSNSLSFDVRSVDAGFSLARGDWVKVETTLDPGSGSRRIDAVKPLREKAFEGEITSMHGGFGYINDNIYFTFNTCGDYVPKRNDIVRGHAIESSRGRSSWRAVEVMPKAPNVERFLKFSQTSLTQNSALSDLLRNKEGIKITEVVDFGDMKLNDVAATKLFIRNGGSKMHTLRSTRVCDSGHGQFSIDEINYVPPNKEIDPNTAFITPPGKSLVVTIVCKASNLGQDQQLMVFDFGEFKIGRHLKVTVHDSSFKSILEPNAPYQRKNCAKQYRLGLEEQGRGWVIAGQRPARKRAVQLPNRLPEYPIPVGLEEVYIHKGNLEVQAPSLGEVLDANNYSARFSALLHVEEIQQNINIREFDIERTCMRSCGEFLALKVPGLSEGRPSVLVGDRVLATAPGEYSSEPTHEGFAHQVLNEEILVKLHPEFHQSYNGQDYDIRFVLSRTQLRRCHQAVEFAPTLGSEVLFPSNLVPKIPQTSFGTWKRPVNTCSSPGKREAERHQFINKTLNVRQKSAVLRILSGQSRPTPYIIFGPPGTGKTITLVEALIQVHLSVSSSRIIVCAPSNSAADLITTRLHLSGVVKKNELVRLNSYSRSEQEIPELIEAYCKTGDDLELVSRHRILVSTCSSAGMMYTLGLKPGHFTHAFIDEAGQATEPEIMIPIGLVAGTDGQVVLAGDPLQLGPVLQSKIADRLGLGLSYLERLIQLPLYARNERKFADHGSYDPLLVTKLVQNYRSHAALVKLPSLVFYHNELEVSADPKVTNQLISWDKLPNPVFPIIFHSIRGQDMREGSSPSWFNPMEVLQVMRYLQCLMDNPLTKLTMEDIGIIAPYRKQVEKIRLLIDKLGMEEVKVGSVEEFQGQERPVMILSTVRSNEKHINSDVIHNLGFLSNPKRFNVSISRAQALMIVVGNPHVLCQDEHWRVLLQYCFHHGAFTGSDIPELGPADGLDFSLSPPQVSPSEEEKKKCASLRKSDTKQAAVSREQGATEDASRPITAVSQSDFRQPRNSSCSEGGLLSSESDGDDETLSAHSMDTDTADCSMLNKTLENVLSLDSQCGADTDDTKESNLPTTHLVEAKSTREIDSSVHKGLTKTTDVRVVGDPGAPADLNKDSSSNVSRTKSLSPSDTGLPLSPSQGLSPCSAFSPASRKSGKRRSIADRLSEYVSENRRQESSTAQRTPGHMESDSKEVNSEMTVGDKHVSLKEGTSDKVSISNSSNQLEVHGGENTMPSSINTLRSLPKQNISPVQQKRSSSLTEVFSMSPSEKRPAALGDHGAASELGRHPKVNDASCPDNAVHTKSVHLSENHNNPLHPDPPLCHDYEKKITTESGPPSLLEQKIIKQIEYYFGDVNLFKDKFMQVQIAMDCGWVPFSVLITFRRLRMMTQDFNVISTALLKSKSGLLEVDVKGNRVRRSLERPIPSDYNHWLDRLRWRSVFVMGLETKVDKDDDLESHFGQWGEVEHIRPLTATRKASPTTYPFIVIYRNPEDARRVLFSSQGHRYKQSMLFAYQRDNIAEMLYSHLKNKPNNKAMNETKATQSKRLMSVNRPKNDGLLPAPEMVPRPLGAHQCGDGKANAYGAAREGSHTLHSPRTDNSAPGLLGEYSSGDRNMNTYGAASDGIPKLTSLHPEKRGLLPHPVPAHFGVHSNQNQNISSYGAAEELSHVQPLPQRVQHSGGVGRVRSVGRGRARFFKSSEPTPGQPLDWSVAGDNFFNVPVQDGAKILRENTATIQTESSNNTTQNDSCLEQNDSDVIVESSDEEFSTY